MGIQPIQIPTGPLLPVIWVTGAETEAVADIVTHVSTEVECTYLQEKEVHVIALEVGGIAPPLWLWIELSPYLTTTTPLFWAAIGGGGGALPPTVPLVVVGIGIGTLHSVLLPWAIHSSYFRVVAQTPVMGAGAWAVQVQMTGKTP